MQKPQLLAWKISKTRKKLSKARSYFAVSFICLGGLGSLLMQEIYISSLSKNVSVVKTELPFFIPTKWKDSLKKTSGLELEELGPNSPVVFIASNNFFIGDLKSFTTDYLDASKKFKIPFIDQRPLLQPLLRALKSFEILRYQNRKEQRPKHLVILTSNHIPAAILLQTINGIKKFSGYEHVVLGDAKF